MGLLRDDNGADMPMLKTKDATILMPEKSVGKKTYKYKRLFTVICVLSTLMWLAWLTIKLEKKNDTTKIYSSYDLEEILEEKVKAENETKAMMKIIQHLAQDENSKNTSVSGEREERAVLQVISGAFSVLSMVCSAAKIIHQAVADDARVGVYGRFYNQTKFYQENSLLYKNQILCKQTHVEGINDRIMKTLKTYQYSKVRANAIKETYTTVLKGMKSYQDDLRDPKKVKTTTKDIEDFKNMVTQDVQAGIQFRESYIADIAFVVEDAISLAVGGVGGTILNTLAGHANIAFDFAGVASGISIAKSIFKLVYCIKGHFDIYGEKKDQLDAAKTQHDSAKDAYHQLTKIIANLDKEVDLMNAKISLLTDYANLMFKRFGTNCTSSSGTLISDLEEIDSFVTTLKRNFDLTVDISASMTYVNEIISDDLEDEKEEMEEDGETMTKEEETKFINKRMKRNVRSQYKSLAKKHPHIEPDILIEKMKIVGFKFLFTWSQWMTTADDRSCSCKTSDSQCFVTKERTCTSGRCLGPKESTYDRCVKEKFNFFNKCRSQDLGLVGSCVTKNNAKIESGDLSGQYVSAGVKEGQCMKDCKSLPGVRGCEYMKTSCSATKGCRGECFAVTEDVHRGDRMPDVTCYKFKMPTKGVAALPVLQQVFDATEQMMKGQDFDSIAFNEMYLYFLKIDPSIIEAQENAWKEMAKYQSTGLADKWGQNPSIYQERGKRSLSFQNGSTTIFEPCNFASNWAYFHLAAATKNLRWIRDEKPETLRALVQASTGLAFSSSFFHGSHTELGQLIDNHMIKIIAYILYQTHIETSGFKNPILTDLVPHGNRDMTGVQMAENMKNIFKDYPATEWGKKVEEMNVPNYEISFSALILTLLEQMEYTGGITNVIITNMMTSMKVPTKDITFLKENFKPTLKLSVTAWNKENDNFLKKPDSFNTLVAILRSLAAFPFQESYSYGHQVPLKFFEWVIQQINGVSISKKLLSPLDVFNEKLNHFSTLPEIEPIKLGRKDLCPFDEQYQEPTDAELFPGYNECTSNANTKHSVWHAQSARGILDFFKLADEFIRKQTNHMNPTTAEDFDKVTQEAQQIAADAFNDLKNAGENLGNHIAESAEEAMNAGMEIRNDFVNEIGKGEKKLTNAMNNIGKTGMDSISDISNMFGK